MNAIGSVDQWVDLIETQVPDIIQMIVSTWEDMPAPACDALEDQVSERLCKALRNSRNRCDLPFRIDTQLVELDPAAGEDQGRMDIVFSPMVPRENIYFCLECKRLNVRTTNGVRPYHSEYVTYGMTRFVVGQYASNVRHGGMLAFVLDGDIDKAIAGVQLNVAASQAALGMSPPGLFMASTHVPTDTRIRETHHRRDISKDVFLIHHIFMAGDPTALPRLASIPAANAASPAHSKLRGRAKR